MNFEAFKGSANGGIKYLRACGTELCVWFLQCFPSSLLEGWGKKAMNIVEFEVEI